MSGRFRDTLRVSLRLIDLEDRLTPALNSSILTPLSYDPTRVLVTFANPTTNGSDLAELQNNPLTQSVDPLGFGIYRVNLKATESVPEATTQLASLPGVQTAQPDYAVRVESTPNDPQYSSQWAYHNTGQNGGVKGVDIGMPAAWNVTTGTGSTIVAIIDTGIDTTHPDLAANLWRNPGEIAGNGVDDNKDGFVDNVNGVNFLDNNGNVTDTSSHGTHVAGIIGAVGGNGIGVAGINWHVRIMALKFMGANGGFTSDAVRAMNYAVTNGAKIINNSWGGSGYDAATSAAIIRARDAGVIVVNAAGNTAQNNDASAFYPANYITQSDNVVTVAATDSSDNLAYYSNYGRNTVTLAAPGTDIRSTLPNNSYGSLSGTSMATPMVSGALALLWDLHPTWSYRQIITKLQSSVDLVPSLAGKTITGGRLDVAKMLDATTVSPPVTPPVVPPPAPPVVSPPAPPVVPPPAPPVTPPPPTTIVDNAFRITNATFSGPRVGQLDRIYLTFSSPVNPSTLNNSTITVSGPAGAMRISAVIPIAGKNNTQFVLMFSKNQVTSGSYTATIGPKVLTATGTAMDQNNNGVAGESTDSYKVTTTLVGKSSVASVATVGQNIPVTPPPIVPPTPTPTATPVPSGVPLVSISATDLRKASEPLKAAILEGRHDQIVTPPQTDTSVPTVPKSTGTTSTLHRNNISMVSQPSGSLDSILFKLHSKLFELSNR